MYHYCKCYLSNVQIYFPKLQCTFKYFNIFIQLDPYLETLCAQSQSIKGAMEALRGK